MSKNSNFILKKIIGEIQRKDFQRPSVVALLLANLVPVFGVIFFKWEVFPLLFLFWFENVIIGVFNVLKMLFASPGNVGAWFGKFFIIPFFCVHYGIFTMVHGAFVVGFFGRNYGVGRSFPNLDTVLQIVRETHLGWAVFGLATSRAISFLTNYIWRGEYRQANVQILMAQPYGRVIVLHLAIIFGGFLMMALHSPALGLLLLVALKTMLDLAAHLRERKKFSAVFSTTVATRAFF